MYVPEPHSSIVIVKLVKSLRRHAWWFSSSLKWCTLMLAHLCQYAGKYFNSTSLAFHQQLSLWETCTDRTHHNTARTTDQATEI